MKNEEIPIQPIIVSNIVEEVKQPILDKTNITPENKNKSETKISALSLSSIKAKKELEAKQLIHTKHDGELPTETFSETNMLLLWNKFAARLADQNKRLMATYMLMSKPTLNCPIITIELPNESTKIEFEAGNNELLGYLRGKLHNHDITIEVIVNETVETKYAFTPDDKYEKLKSINPTMELLRKVFDLDV
ncbi:DNA polymerase III subunit gamma/tau [Flavobacterium sp. N2270]|uniref:DNA polymerase III subunit gamma/tau n=1 Tax=Flavobacterium sp. N2270 TaxID=2986831 RepID=UPI00222496D6|nr:DNA polymerase III subunit gamma/tau [Flavobacterium sp. N2270]